MVRLKLFLLGKFCIQQDGRLVSGLEGRKAQELLGYLILFRDRPHVRGKLTELLWPNKEPSQSRRYLRQTLWQIQSALNADNDSIEDLILVESNWLQINPQADYWSDVTKLEQCAIKVQGVQGIDFSVDIACKVKAATDYYQGGLLENCYEEWCVLERDRLQNIYLSLLDKLMDYCQVRKEYGAGIDYGTRILRADIARERTYRKLMRLYSLKYDRTGALRHFWRCKRALEQELGVQPAQKTMTLYESIRDGRPLYNKALPVMRSVSMPMSDSDATAILISLDQISSAMLESYEQLQQNVAAVRKVLQNKH